MIIALQDRKSVVALKVALQRGLPCGHLENQTEQSIGVISNGA